MEKSKLLYTILYFEYCNLFIRKNLLERYLLEKIKSLVKNL